MPISAAQLVGKVTIDGADEGESKLKRVGSAVDETQGKLSGGLLGGLKNAASGFLDFGAKLGQTVIGIKGLADGAVGLAQSLLAPAASAEQVEGSLEVFTHSATKAKQVMSDLASFASHTPFETQDIDQAALKLMSVGVSAKDVIPDLLALGDGLDAVGRTSGADLGMITDTFLKIKTEGKLSSEAMNSFAAQGIDAWSVLEKQTGKTHAQLQAMISGGLYPADKAMKDLTAGMEKNPLYKGQMANDANVFNGALSTLKSNWTQLLAGFGSPVIKALEPLINNLASSMASPAFKDFATMIGTKLVQGVSDLAGWLQRNLVPAFNDFMRVIRSPEMGQLGGKLGELGNTLRSVVAPALADSKNQSHDFFSFMQTTAIPALSGLVSGLNQSIKFVRDHGAQFQAAGVIIAGIYTPAIIKAGVESVIAGAKSSASFVTSIVKTGIEGWQAAAKLQLWIGEIIASGARAVVAGAQITISFVGSMVKAGVEATIAGAKVVASFVASMIAAGAQAVVTGAKIVASFIAALISAAVEAAVSAGVMLSTLVPALAAVAVEVIAATWPFLLAGVVIAAVVVGIVLAVRNWGAIAHWLQGVWGGFSSWFMGILGQVGAFFQAAWQRMLSVAQSIWAGIVAVVRSNAYLLLAIVIGPIGALTVYILTHWEQVAGATRQLGATITGIFSSWAGAAYNAGVSIVSQVVAGIQSMIGQAGAAMSNLAAEISAHLPKSPAKKGPLMDIHMRMPSMVKMLSEGIEAGIPKLEASIRHLVSPMSGNLQPQGSFSGGGSSLMLPRITTQPQIIVQPTPVYLDGRALAHGLMPYTVDLIRAGAGVHGM